MLHTIENMRTVARLCQHGQPLPGELAEWLGHSLQSFLDRQATSLNDAFGVRNARGGIPWRVESCMRMRDSALRRLAEEYFFDLSLSAQAEQIHRLSLRYAASSWRFDREREAMPEAYRGTASEWLWTAFKSGTAMPLCARRLRSILVP